jgi:hypothetical protein
MNNNNNTNIIPILSYYNANILKEKILETNKRKCGIYRWINLITGKCYIGSSTSLSCRFSKYYSLNYLRTSLKKTSSIIYSSLLKYGYSNFSLDILEYCEPNLLLKREQYYIDILNPEYNILRIAGSCFGRKHSLKTRERISNSLKNHWLKLLPVKVTNIETDTIEYFPNYLEAAKHLGINIRTLSKYKSKGEILKKKYLITNNIN